MSNPANYVIYLTFVPSAHEERSPTERALRMYCVWAELDVVIQALHADSDVKSMRVCVDVNTLVRPLTHADMGYTPLWMPKIL